MRAIIKKGYTVTGTVSFPFFYPFPLDLTHQEMLAGPAVVCVLFLYSSRPVELWKVEPLRCIGSGGLRTNTSGHRASKRAGGDEDESIRPAAQGL